MREKSSVPGVAAYQLVGTAARALGIGEVAAGSRRQALIKAGLAAQTKGRDRTLPQNTARHAAILVLGFMQPAPDTQIVPGVIETYRLRARGKVERYLQPPRHLSAPDESVGDAAFGEVVEALILAFHHPDRKKREAFRRRFVGISIDSSRMGTVSFVDSTFACFHGERGSAEAGMTVSVSVSAEALLQIADCVEASRIEAKERGIEIAPLPPEALQALTGKTPAPDQGAQGIERARSVEERALVDGRNGRSESVATGHQTPRTICSDGHIGKLSHRPAHLTTGAGWNEQDERGASGAAATK